MKQAAIKVAIGLVICVSFAFSQTPTIQFPPAVMEKKASVVAVRMDVPGIVKADGVTVADTFVLEKKDKPIVIRFEVSGYPSIERTVVPGNHYVILIAASFITNNASVLEFDQPPDQLDSAVLASIISISESSLAAPSSNAAQVSRAKATPFGFEAGMTKEQVIAKLGKDALVQDQGVLVAFNSAPDPHPDFVLYQCGFSPEQGLIKVIGISKKIETSEYGNELQAQFHTFRDALAEKYGKPGTDVDACKGNRVDCNDKFFMSSLKSEIRALDSFWKTNLPANLESISLESDAIDSNSGYIAVSYEFQGWSKFADKINQRHNSSF